MFTPIHNTLWSALEDYVRGACEGRDDSHGLAHMMRVTEQAVALYLIDAVSTSPCTVGDDEEERAALIQWLTDCPRKADYMAGSSALNTKMLAALSTICSSPSLATGLARVMAIAMLHDVNDHKYEKPDGSLSAGLQRFVDGDLTADNGAFSELLFPSTATEASSAPNATQSDRAAKIMATISAISFSKEKKQGMRYFVPMLGSEWTVVRDFVSDADKIEAIGPLGLVRCWNFNIEMKTHKEGSEAIAKIFSDAAAKESFRQTNFQDVKDHVDEKLAILRDAYIVTKVGKDVSLSFHDGMLDLLAEWERTGCPQL